MATGLRLYDAQGRVTLDSKDSITRQIYEVTKTLSLHATSGWDEGRIAIESLASLNHAGVTVSVIGHSGTPMVMIGAYIESDSRSIYWRARPFHQGSTVTAVFTVYAYG
ncbi:hypothetical protein GCM10023116_27660 [Kistimonas scapharcae]|uniref:Phage tail protein n=1 Tax=Kistimonas scapharcae TaxID=1036133 RepID=A0ABP8V4U3_9GAMM